MGKVIRETIRLWGNNFFDRTCTKDYFIPELNFTVPKGMHVTLAGGKMMRDSAYFERPLEFNPDLHFAGSESMYSHNFIGFGLGPRSCIGMRLAYTLVRAGLLHTLAKFKIVRGSKFQEDWIWNPAIPGGLGHDVLHVQLEPRLYK